MESWNEQSLSGISDELGIMEDYCIIQGIQEDEEGLLYSHFNLHAYDGGDEEEELGGLDEFDDDEDEDDDDEFFDDDELDEEDLDEDLDEEDFYDEEVEDLEGFAEEEA